MIRRLLAATLALGFVALGAVAADDAAANQLTDKEKADGWKLLFDGKTTDGWHNFKKEGVKPGWQIKDGTLVCADPHNAGDIVTTDKFQWFELVLDYNIAEKGNSGVMVHIGDVGGAMWASGPEIQLQDNVKGTDPQLSGWLYQLYKPPIDPKTDKPLDATKPVGEWNHLKILIAPPPAKSEVVVNGQKYYDFVWDSDDFKDRIAKSKFKSMKDFAKFDTGYIGLQGDHGEVSFRNIKIRPISKPTTATKIVK